MVRKNVIIGMIGTTLDQGGAKQDRWERWRPSVAICQHEDFVVDRFELLVPPVAIKLAEQVCADIASISPDTEVRVHTFDVPNPWDFGDVYAKLGDFADAYRWHTDREDY
ncbi:MAG TPA: RNA repair transcriptional activator RtcR family protein, partial [Kofleriaceae bacterium]